MWNLYQPGFTRHGASIALMLLGCTTAARAQWCDLLFKDVSERANAIVLVDYDGQGGQRPGAVHVLEVWKGAINGRELGLDLGELAAFEPRAGDRFLLALDPKHQPIAYVGGAGSCSAIGVLRIRDGRLKPRDREDYDGARAPMTLDQLRAELQGLAGGQARTLTLHSAR